MSSEKTEGNPGTVTDLPEGGWTRRVFFSLTLAGTREEALPTGHGRMDALGMSRPLDESLTIAREQPCLPASSDITMRKP
jgi:hypothetical protein